MAAPASSSTAGRIPRAAHELVAGAVGHGCLDDAVAEAHLFLLHVHRQRLEVGWVATRHGMPSITQLPKKISPKEPPTMARMPQPMSTCGACSREEPQPKFWPTTSTAGFLVGGERW